MVGDDKVMQERLGHADIEITLNTYTHTVSEQHRRAGNGSTKCLFLRHSGSFSGNCATFAHFARTTRRTKFQTLTGVVYELRMGGRLGGS